MPNTGCSPSCEKNTRTISLFGKPLTIKGYICTEDGITYPPKPPRAQLQLTICPTSFCPASCPFCVASDTDRKDRVDIGRLARVLAHLKEKDLVRGVTITGGEPFLDVPLLDDTLSLVYETFGTKMEVSLNTNGINLHRLREIKTLPHLDALHISRHHMDDHVNQRLFGIPVPGGRELGEILHSMPYKDLFVLNCILLRDGIATPQDAHRFLDFAIGAGAGKVAFITVMPINDYARAQRVPFEDVLRPDDPAMLYTRGYRDYDICRCQDGIYASARGGIIEFYGRTTQAGDCGCCRGLVYGADNHLHPGFSREIIV